VSERYAGFTDFLFFSDSTQDVKKLTIRSPQKKLSIGDVISFFEADNCLASYKVIEIDLAYTLFEAHIPLGTLISWKPPVRRFRIKICEERIRIYRAREDDFARDETIGVLSIIPK
jgi:hypothetical protein